MTISFKDALEVIQLLEPKLASNGYHCALTGSTLYKGESEKDIDILIYPHDPAKTMPHENLWDIFSASGLTDRFVTDRNYVNRIVWIFGWKNMRVDVFIMEDKP